MAYKAMMTRYRFAVVAAAALSGVIGLTGRTTAEAATPTVQFAQAAAAGRPVTFADLERLYLDGKISAKQYQKLLSDLKANPPPAPAPAPAQPVKASVPGPAPAVVSKPPPVIPQTNKDDKITEVETKMDELLRAKAAREKATNSPAKVVSAGPKTKRERLNDLLRLYIEGKVSETEMNERRAKIVAEPD